MAIATIRRDGLFGSLYAKEHNAGDLVCIIRKYRVLTGASYKQAWADWFEWAGENVC